MAHRRARLTQFGRLLIIRRVLEEGWSVAATAEAVGVSRATAHKWLRRFREEGLVGLQDRSSAPHHLPRALPRAEVARIVRARRHLKFGPHRLAPELGHPRSTVYGVLRRHGLSRLAHLDRPTGIPVRYERARAGELVHVDVKKLGKIRPGGGWKIRGRSAETRAGRYDGRVGYDYLHVAVDDHSRYAYVEALADEKGPTCSAFLLRAAERLEDLGVRVEVVMTDQAKNYISSRDFAAAIAELGARHLVTAVPAADQWQG